MDINKVFRLGRVLILLLTLLAAIFFYGAPVSDQTSLSGEAFSMENALSTVKEITKAPHPVESDEHARVADFLTRSLQEMGLEPEIQETTYSLEDTEYSCEVKNIFTYVKGSDPQKTLLFSAHYDSTENSPGAGDNGAAVASLLESIRVLQTEPALKNNVIFLFCDAEEYAAFGSRAFSEHHPLAKEVDLVFNFDGRGNGGPVLMFETSANNSWLIREFDRATSHPVGTSLSNAVYKYMPNYTDFTFFMHHIEGAEGLNFAHIENPRAYHDSSDTWDTLDPGVIRHV